MPLQVRLQQISPDAASITALRNEAARQGLGFLDRLVEDWAAGTNRFQAPGEKLLGAFAGEQLVGIAGLNREPYEPAPGRARLRHMYVSRAFRRRGVATALVTHLLEDARTSFEEMRLRTDSAEAAVFYEQLGFSPMPLEGATHIRFLQDRRRP